MSQSKVKQNGKSGNNKVRWNGFVNVYLSKADKAAIKSSLLDDAAIIRLVEHLTENGYKVSTSYSQAGGFYTVTAYGNVPDCPNAGWAMSLRHSSLVVAYSSLQHVLGVEGVSEDWSERFTTVDDNDW